MHERPKDHLSYRRGPVLGFPIAETILFFVLVLLLALSLVLLKKDSEIRKLKETVSAISENPVLANKISSLNETVNSVPNDQNMSDDMLNEIKALREDNKKLQQDVEALKKNLAEVDEVLKDGNLKSGDKRAESIREAVTINGACDKLSDQGGIDSLVLSLKIKDLEIATLKDEGRYLRNEGGYLRYQLENCRGPGKGPSYPEEYFDF